MKPFIDKKTFVALVVLAALYFLATYAGLANADELTVFRNGVTYQWNGVITIAENDPWGNSGFVSMSYAASVADGIFADAFAQAPPESPWVVNVYTGPTTLLSIRGYCQGETGYGDDHGGLAVYVFCSIND